MSRYGWQAGLAIVVWTVVLAYLGLPLPLAVLIPVDVALVVLAVLLRWGTSRT